MSITVPYEKRLKIAVDVLRGKTITETATKFNVGTTTVKRYVETFKNDPYVIKMLKRVKYHDSRLPEKITAEIIEEGNKLIEEIKVEAREINKLAVTRIKELIPDEENLEKVLKAYQLTSEIIIPKTDEPKDINKTLNVFQLINNQLSVKNDESEN